MSLFTHWACFKCRKSFHKLPSEGIWKCPECSKQMTEMGIYFEPPRKQATKQWKVMQLLAENGYKFQTEGSKAYIDSVILKTKNPRIKQVKEIIETHKQERIKDRQEQRIKIFKESKGKL